MTPNEPRLRGPGLTSTRLHLRQARPCSRIGLVLQPHWPTPSPATCPNASPRWCPGRQWPRPSRWRWPGSSATRTRAPIRMGAWDPCRGSGTGQSCGATGRFPARCGTASGNHPAQPPRSCWANRGYRQSTPLTWPAALLLWAFYIWIGNPRFGERRRRGGRSGRGRGAAPQSARPQHDGTSALFVR